MSMTTSVIFGVTSDGIPIFSGSVVESTDALTTAQVQHVASSSQFVAESWDGEHGEHEHHPEETVRRDSIFATDLSGDVIQQDTPIASSSQFERQRSASLVNALLEMDPHGVPLVQFFKLAAQPLLEIDEDEEAVEPSDTELVLARLLFTLQSVRMAAPEKHEAAVNRLRQLEEELREAGAITPADPAVSEAVARALAVAGAGKDVQIRVNQSRHTTTTKTVYETETPGLAGLESDKIRELQQDILNNLSAGANDNNSDSGTTQKKETAEEGFTNEDGSVVVSKKMTRVVTTTRTTLPGEEPALGE